MNYQEHYLKNIIGAFGSLEDAYIAVKKLLRTIEPMQKAIKRELRAKPLNHETKIKFKNLKDYLENNFPFYMYMSYNAIKNENKIKGYVTPVENNIQSFSDQLSNNLKMYYVLYKWLKRWWRTGVTKITPEMFRGAMFCAGMDPFELRYYYKNTNSNIRKYKDLDEDNKTEVFQHMESISKMVCYILR